MSGSEKESREQELETKITKQKKQDGGSKDKLPPYYEVGAETPKIVSKTENRKRSSSDSRQKKSQSRSRSRQKKHHAQRNVGWKNRQSSSSHRQDKFHDRYRRNEGNRITNDNIPKEEAYRKTKMCPQFQKGQCRKGGDCNFAHSESQLRGLPDFKKTKLCIAFKEGKCGKPSSQCKYAHGQGQLRRIPKVGDDRDKRRQRSPRRDYDRDRGSRPDYHPVYPPYPPYGSYPPPYMSIPFQQLDPMYGSMYNPSMMGPPPPNPMPRGNSYGSPPQYPPGPSGPSGPPPGHLGGSGYGPSGGYYPSPYDYYGQYGQPNPYNYPPGPPPKPPM